jgi:erythronate-4-phosphate dehydrogenase
MHIVADANILLVREFFADFGTVQLLPGREICRQDLARADVLLVRSVTRVNEQLLSGSRIRFVATATSGDEHVDRAYLAARQIGFASAPGSNANAVAEYVVASLLATGHRRGFSLAGTTAGIVGLGHVGRLVRTKLTSLGIRCAAHDPPLQEQGMAGLVSLEALAGSDIVTFHVPLTASGPYPTSHMAGQAFFESLPPGAVILNTSRGAVLDSRELKEVLRRRTDLSAVLDVWEDEPDIDPVLLDRAAIATPHIAGYSLDGKLAGSASIYHAACRFFGVPARKKNRDLVARRSIAVLDPGASASDEAVILDVVRRCYDVMDDDRRLREGVLAEPRDRGAVFDQLRRNYPIRREFSCYDVVSPPGVPGCATKLEGLGFGILREP